MTTAIDIRPDHLEIVQDILREHLPSDVKVWVFGSRANWTTKDSSDLDLALEGPGRIDRKVKGALMDAFEDSDLPYTVDVVDMSQVSVSFRQIVEKARSPLALDDSEEYNTGGWLTLKLREVCTKIGSGATPKGGKEVYLEDGPYALIRSQNIYNDGFRFDGLAYIGEDHASELQNVEVEAGDVLLNITGHSVARTCQVAFESLPARVNQHVAIIRTDISKLNPEFLRYYLVSPNIQALLLSLASSGGTRHALTKGMIESLTVSAPPLIEQHAIARVLGAFDDKIELNRRMNKTLEDMTHAIFKDWFVDFGPTRAKIEGREPYLPAGVWDLFPDSFMDSELGEIPKGWQVKSLGDLIELAYGKALKATSRKDGPIPVYGSNGRIDWHDKGLVSGPGIVVGRKGNPGTVTWVQNEFFPIDTTFYVVPRDTDMSLLFLFYALDAQNLPSVAADSAVPGLNRNLAYMNRQVTPDTGTLEEFEKIFGTFFTRRQ